MTAVTSGRRGPPPPGPRAPPQNRGGEQPPPPGAGGGGAGGGGGGGIGSGRSGREVKAPAPSGVHRSRPRKNQVLAEMGTPRRRSPRIIKAPAPRPRPTT